MSEHDLNTLQSTIKRAQEDAQKLFGKLSETTRRDITAFVKANDNTEPSEENYSDIWDQFVNQNSRAADELTKIFDEHKVAYNTLSRKGFLKRASAFGAAIVLASGSLFLSSDKQNESDKTSSSDNEAHSESHGESRHQKAITAVHAFGFGYFAQLIAEMSANPNRKFNKQDYATLIATNVLAMALSSKEERGDMIHELEMGYGSLSLVIPFAAAMEGVSADLGTILKARLKSNDISRSDMIAGSAVLSNAMARYYGLTISAAKSFGDEIIEMADQMVLHNNGDQKLAKQFIARSIAHTGNNSSLGINPLFPGDPPVIYQLLKYGYLSTAMLSGAYYSIPGLFSTFQTAVAGNKAFGIPNPRHEALKSSAKIYTKVFTPFVLANLGNTFFNSNSPVGARIEIKERIKEARDNLKEITKANPDSRTNFTHAAHPHAELIKMLSAELTNFEQSEYDPLASDMENLIEEIVGKNGDANRAAAQLQDILAEATLCEDQDRANGLFAMADAKIDAIFEQSPDEERQGQLKGLLRGFWVMNDEIRRGVDLSDLDNIPLKIKKMSKRILNHERMMDTLGHANNDLIAVASGQMLVVNHAVYIISRALKGVMKSDMWNSAKLALFMESIRHPSGFADNLAAGIMGDKVAQNLGLPFIAANFSASIQGGGNALPGNPAANYSIKPPHGKNISFEMSDSMKNYLLTTDIALVNVANTALLNNKNVEEKIFRNIKRFGEHPNRKNADEATLRKMYMAEENSELTAAVEASGMSRSGFIKSFIPG